MSENTQAENRKFTPPPIERTQDGDITTTSLAEVIQWFLNYDEKVRVIKHPSVEEVFQWKQEQSRNEDESVYLFQSAEDRLAIGILNALGEHATEPQLHQWISQLLNALEDATRANEEIAESADLGAVETDSAIMRANLLPTAEERLVYLNFCWLEALCTAEIRVLGWVYQDLYGRAFHPNNF
jgi:hypothetical protein